MNKLLPLICAATLIALTPARANDYGFKHITQSNGLSNNQVNDIYKDADGFVWFSTSWGLNRYDGYEMTVFLSEPDDSTTLLANFIEWTRDIPGDRMLVKMGENYNIYDKHTEKFSNGINYFKSIGITDWISAVCVDTKSNIWFGLTTKAALYTADGKLLEIKTETPIPAQAGNIVSIAQSSEGAVFIYNDGTVVSCKIDPAGKILTRVEQTPVDYGQHHTIFVDSDHDYWVTTSTKHGLWYRESRSAKWFYCDNKPTSKFQLSTPDFIVNGFAEDSKNHIWIVSDHGGINIVDKRANDIKTLVADAQNPRNILDNSVRCAYTDNEGIVWIGYFKDGVSMYDESIFKFEMLPLDLSSIDLEFKSDINSIKEDRNGNLWIGTNGSGLICIEKSGKKRQYKCNPNDPHTLSNNIIVDILAAENGDIWIGTFMGGLCRFDGKTFERYMSRKDLPAAMSCENIWAVTEDADNKIWIGSLGKGVVAYDPKTKKFEEYTEESGKISSNYVSAIICSRDGSVYVGSAVGVTILNPANNSSKHMTDNQQQQIIENVYDLFEDSRGLIWVGTGNGVFIYNKRNNTTTHLTMREGLINDVISGIVEDNSKNIWITTASGVSNVYASINPKTKEYDFTSSNYSELDGLQRGSFNKKSIIKTSYGDILLGGGYGINRLTPETMQFNANTPTVHFTGLQVFGEKVNIGADDGILSQALAYCDAVTFNYTQNMFSVKFSTLSAVLPEKVRYSYMLEGFNDKWITTSQPQATYTNLAPGDYTLKVKATNCDGYTSDSEAELLITILPPWWKSNMAMAMYIALFIIVCLIIRMQITHKERDKYKLRQIESEAQQKHDIDDMKLRFFTNVSHELRTPLSLIISPLETLLETTEDETLKKKLELIHRNATKLLNMVNQLLDFRKADVSEMKLNLSEGDLVAFVKQTSETFVALTERDINFSFSAANDSLYMEFDEDKIGKVITNLLSNAFKFTVDGGRVEAWVGRSTDGKNALIKISDTGIGIPDNEKEHIFERFYQVSHKDGAYGGSGIGLHLVREFVTLHGGTVEVGDNVGQGSIFAVSLPINTTPKDDDKQSENEIKDADNENVEGEDPNKGETTIMIVDDNADFRTLLRDTLTPDYKIIEARNGEEAFEEIVKQMPDLVITDVMMPILDGNELCKRIKNDIRTSHIPVIMLSAKSAEEHKIEGLTNGADDYMPKPFNPQILKLKVTQLIELGKKRQDNFSRQIDPEPSEITITPLDEKLINKAIKYVEDNMARSELSVEEMSRDLGMSRVHLYKKLVSITGRSPIEFIRVIRLKRAAQMLRDKQQNVADVAYAVGFNNPKYFSKYFKEEFGMLPSAFQNSQDDVKTDVGNKDAN